MNLALFFVAAIAVIVAPGSNTIYVVSQTIARGMWHGVYAALAIGLGSLLYAVLRNLPKRGHATFGVRFLLLRRLPG